MTTYHYPPSYFEAVSYSTTEKDSYSDRFATEKSQVLSFQKPTCHLSSAGFNSSHATYPAEAAFRTSHYSDINNHARNSYVYDSARSFATNPQDVSPVGSSRLYGKSAQSTSKDGVSRIIPQPLERLLPNEESVYAQAKARYDNPLAFNETWAPTSEDAKMWQLPKVDLMLRVKARLERTAGSPFDPLPRSFERASRSNWSNFRPVVHIGAGDIIGTGFKPNYIGGVFANLDVSAADYSRFLEDIVTTGKVSGKMLLVSNVAPLTMHLGITGYFVTKAIVKGLAKRNEPLVVETIETWQERFFAPRGLDVFVYHKGQRLTARQIGAPIQPLSSGARQQLESLVGQELAAMEERKKREGRKVDKRDRDNKRLRPILVVAPLSR